MTEIALDFQGPFSFYSGENSLFCSPVAKSAGVYVWTFQQEVDGSHLVHYVGETSGFAKRHRQHLTEVLGLNYGILDPQEAKKGNCVWLWRGMWRDRSPKGPDKTIERYSELGAMVLDYLSGLTIFFAVVDADVVLRRHLEGCVGWNLRRNHPDSIQLYPDDNQLRLSKRLKPIRITMRTAQMIRGLGGEFEM